MNHTIPAVPSSHSKLWQTLHLELAVEQTWTIHWCSLSTSGPQPEYLDSVQQGTILNWKRKLCWLASLIYLESSSYMIVQVNQVLYTDFVVQIQYWFEAVSFSRMCLSLCLSMSLKQRKKPWIREKKIRPHHVP